MLLFVIPAWLGGPDGSKPVPVPRGFDWQGHRGCRGLLPENSIPAFLRALEFPEITTLELDLAVSKDSQLIVSHEPWFKRSICLMPDGSAIGMDQEEKLLIMNYTAGEIRNFDCGSPGNPRFSQQQRMKTWKPTLEEVVRAVRDKYPGKTVNWNLEIKSKPGWDGVRTPPVDAFAALVVRQVEALGLQETSNVQSFDVRVLQAVKKIAPELRIALLVDNVKGLDSNLDKLGFQPDIYSPYNQLVNKKLVQKCLEKGIRIIPWTVNDVFTMRQLILLGVDGIITDFPDKIAGVEGE